MKQQAAIELMWAIIIFPVSNGYPADFMFAADCMFMLKAATCNLLMYGCVV